MGDMELVIYIFALIYFTIIISFFIGMLFNKNSQNTKINHISVIIAARNEEKHLSELLKSLTKQTYMKDKFEVIVVDDRSNDNTAEIVRRFALKYSNIRLLQIKNVQEHLLGKKRALDTGIRAAKYDLLAFTDADCVLNKRWIEQINKHFTEDTDIVAGYSYVNYKNPFFKYLKNLERSSIFALIAGSFGWNWGITITAGNMAYRKELYEKVNGFDNIGSVKSGDDVLMIQKMNKFARKMKFMFHKDSFVKTGRTETVHSQMQQEIRRGSKWIHYTFPVKIMTLFVFVYYIIFLGCFFCFLFAGFSTTQFLVVLFLKIFPEFLLLIYFLIKVHKIKLMWALPIAELIYIPYFVIFGLKGTFGKFKWKE